MGNPFHPNDVVVKGNCKRNKKDVILHVLDRYRISCLDAALQNTPECKPPFLTLTPFEKCFYLLLTPCCPRLGSVEIFRHNSVVLVFMIECDKEEFCVFRHLMSDSCRPLCLAMKFYRRAQSPMTLLSPSPRWSCWQRAYSLGNCDIERGRVN